MRKRRYHTVASIYAALLAMTMAAPVAAQNVAQQQSAQAARDHSAMDMRVADKPAKSTPMDPMDMDEMQSGKAPVDARDSNDYAGSFYNSTLANYEMADKLSIPKILIDELEFATGNEGVGVAWSVLITKGQDDNKLWIRSQGLKNNRERLDPETGAELLWWHSDNPFWGTVVGIRQDFGKGAATWLAAGIEGLAPYWFDMQLTGYLGSDGRLAARAKASYEVLLTNRLVLTPQLETNLYSKQSIDRELGSGFSNVELSARLRYEFSRNFAPYVGIVWEKSVSGTAAFRRSAGDPTVEHRLVAGLRLWF